MVGNARPDPLGRILEGTTMITIVRTFTVAAPAEAVLAHLRDFGTTAQWEAGTEHVTRLGSGPPVVGTTWHSTSKVLGVRSELTCTLEAVESDRLVFAGRNESTTATHTVTVRRVADGTEITRVLEMELHGLAKLATPLLRAELEKLGSASAARLAAVLDRLPSTPERSDLSG